MSLTNDNLKQFSVYDGTQAWCSANTCPKSCFNSDQLFTKRQVNTLMLDAYSTNSTKSDNSCYIYVKGQNVNAGDKATALLQIDKLGAHADENKIFNFTASGVLYASVNSQTAPYVYQYDQAGWHVLFAGKSTGEYMLNSFISGVGISPQGIVFISNGYQTLKRPFLPDVYPPVLGKRFTSVLSINGQNNFLGLSDVLGDLSQSTHIKINGSGQIVVSSVGMTEDAHAYIAQASANDFDG